MKHDIRFVPSADEDLDYYHAREQRIILDGIRRFLETDANVQSNRRKRIRPNPLGPWELRVGDYRIFYEIRADGLVRVLAAGHKRHNELYVRGRRLDL